VREKTKKRSLPVVAPKAKSDLFEVPAGASGEVHQRKRKNLKKKKTANTKATRQGGESKLGPSGKKQLFSEDEILSLDNQ